MGWANGAEIAESVWEEIKDYIPKKNKGEVVLKLVDIFENYDCDTMGECGFVDDYLKWDEDEYEWKRRC